MIARFLIDNLLAALEDTPVVVLHGARQTGKSTLVREIARSSQPRRYLTLDDAVVLSAVREDPAGFLAGFKGPVAIDEVQRAPELFLAIKAEVDRNRTPGRFLLTGSANVLLLPRLAESLAGRMEIQTLWPFSRGEVLSIREEFIDTVFSRKALPWADAPATRSGLSTLLLTGGYPPVIGRASLDRRRAWFSSYVTTILDRDVRDLANIEALHSLPRLLSLLAARTGSLLNFAELSRSAAVPQSTLKRYFALFQATFLVQLIPAWAANLGARLVKSPKVHLVDTGLASYLMGLDEARLSADPTLRGPLLESFVASELVKQTAWSRRKPVLHHYRLNTGQEVDLVLEDLSGQVVGIEVKSSATAKDDDFSGLRSLAHAAGDRFCRGIVLYAGSQTVPFGPRLHAVPLSALWTPRSS